VLNEKTLLFRSCQQESLNNDRWRHAARDIEVERRQMWFVIASAA